MTRRLAIALPALFLSIAIAGCAAAPRQTPRPGELIPGPILTFPVMREKDGIPILCNAAAAVERVEGVFEGDPTRSSQAAWLRASDGRQLTVAWPEGFTVRFEPLAVLYNELGRAVVRHGVGVRLDQVNVFDHAGTLADPYLAQGLVFDGCYIVAR